MPDLNTSLELAVSRRCPYGPLWVLGLETWGKQAGRVTLVVSIFADRNQFANSLREWQRL